MTDAVPDLSRLRIPREGSAGSGGRAGWWAALLLLLLLGAYASWREGWLPQAWLPAALQAGDDRPRVSVGRVEAISGAPARSGVAANGYVVARRRAALSTDIQGRIVEITVEEGDEVAEGDLIARLDTRQLEASLDSARAELARQQVLLEQAERDFQRYESLVSSGEVSVSERDNAASQRDATAALASSLQARIDEVAVMIDKSSVYAPFAGRITAKNAEVGEVVAALGNSGSTARGAVATLVDFATLEVQVELAQTSLVAVREGGGASIFLDAWPDHGYAGQVRQIWPTANRQKATVEVRIEFLERDGSILPEMGVRVVFADGAADPASESGPAVRVPSAALLGSGDERAVLLVLDGRLVRRSVRLAGDPVGASAAVASGLTGGETVVLNPDAGLTEGMAVAVEPAS